MTLWNPPSVTKEMDNKQVANLVAELIDDVAFIMNGNIDWKNIRAQSIQTENLAAGSITADKIAANAVTASKIDVDELSAISADLGHITAGSVDAITITGSIITGSLIQTDVSGNYPRIELSSTNNILSAYASAGRSIDIAAFFTGNPAMIWWGNTVSFITENNSRMEINSNSDIYLTPDGFVRVDNWSKILNANTGRTLLQDLFDGGGVTANFFVDSFGDTIILEFENGLLKNWEYLNS